MHRIGKSAVGCVRGLPDNLYELDARAGWQRGTQPFVPQGEHALKRPRLVSVFFTLLSVARPTPFIGKMENL